MAKRHTDIINDVLERYHEAEDARRGIEEIMLENYRLYRRVDPELQRRQQEGRSALFIPKTYATVETAVRYMVNATLAERPYVFGYPRVESNELAFLRAATMQTLIDYQLAERIQIRSLLTKAYRACLIFGYIPAQIGWLQRRRSRRRRERNELGVVIGTTTENGVIVENRPDIRLHDPLGFFIDPFAESLQDAEFVITQRFVTNRWLDERRDLFGSRVVNKALRENLRADELPVWFDVKRRLRGWTDSHTKRLNEVLELWTPGGVITLWNRRVVLRNLEENPFDHGELPFAVGVDVGFVNEFYGEGIVRPMADLQVELNAKRNQRMDNVNFLLNKVFTVLKTSDLTQEDLNLYPGKIIPVDDHDEIRPLDMDDVTASSYNEETIIDKDIQDATGIYPYMQGAAPQFSRERATTVLALQSSGNEGLRLRVNLLEETFLLPIVRQMADLNQQFMQPREFVRITGPDGLSHFIEISANDVVGDFDFYWAGSTVDNVAERQFKVQQLIQLLGIVNQAEGLDINRRELIRQILKLSGVRNVNQIVPPQDVLQQVLAGAMGSTAAEPVVGGAGAVPEVGGADPAQSLPGVGRSLRIGPTPFESPVP